MITLMDTKMQKTIGMKTMIKDYKFRVSEPGLTFCFLNGKDIQVPCHGHQYQEIIILIHGFVWYKFLEPVAKTVIGAIIFQSISSEDWIRFVGSDVDRCGCVGGLNVFVAMIHSDDFCVSDFSQKNSICIDFLSSSYLRGTGLL